MIKKFFATDKSFSTTILRVILGAVMFPHGAQKLLGWFGGRGYEATILGFTRGNLHLPEFLAVLVVLTESVGALALVAGSSPGSPPWPSPWTWPAPSSSCI